MTRTVSTEEKQKKKGKTGRTPTWDVDLARFLFVVRVTFLRMAGMDSMTQYKLNLRQHELGNKSVELFQGPIYSHYQFIASGSTLATSATACAYSNCTFQQAHRAMQQTEQCNEQNDSSPSCFEVSNVQQ